MEEILSLEASVGQSSDHFFNREVGQDSTELVIKELEYTQSTDRNRTVYTQNTDNNRAVFTQRTDDNRPLHTTQRTDDNRVLFTTQSTDTNRTVAAQSQEDSWKSLLEFTESHNQGPGIHMIFGGLVILRGFISPLLHSLFLLFYLKGLNSLNGKILIEYMFYISNMDESSIGAV